MLFDQISELSVGQGEFPQAGVWKVKNKNKICPRARDPPMAKRDSNGNLFTNADGLKSLYLDTYKRRLRHRTIESKYDDILLLKHELCNFRLFSCDSSSRNGSVR